MYDLSILGAEIYHEGRLKHWNIYLQGEKIAAMSPAVFSARKEINAEGLKIFPGIIDPHVHFQLKAGRWTSADTFLSGSRAGLYGGVCTFIDFLDPCSRGDQISTALSHRRELARESLSDYSFHACAADPVGQCRNISQQALELGIPSVKLFTAYSETKRRTYEPELEEFLSLSEELGTTILVHAENEEYLQIDPKATPHDLPEIRPALAEKSMAEKLGHLVRARGGTLYMVHCSSGDTLEMLRREFPELLNKNFFVESCPQYFLLDQELFSSDEAWRYVLAPPLRSKEEQQKLKDGIDHIYSIGTDHCPFLDKEKKQEFLRDIPFGIGGIQYSFPLLYSLFGLGVVDKMTRHPAELFHLPFKGQLEEGFDADFFLYDQRHPSSIGDNYSRAPILYRGMKVNGTVISTFIRGQAVLEEGDIKPYQGKFIKRKTGGRP